MSRTRKNDTPEEKVAILKRHLVEKAPVSDLCDELGLHPTAPDKSAVCDDVVQRVDWMKGCVLCPK
jgi:hypothetical protein